MLRQEVENGEMAGKKSSWNPNFSDPDEGLLSTESIESLRRKLLAASYTAHGSDLGALFDRMDKDKSGAIEMEELKSMVKKMLPHVSDDHIQEIFGIIDVSGNGRIEKDEFILFVDSRSSMQSDSAGCSDDINSTTPDAIINMISRKSSDAEVIDEIKDNCVPSSSTLAKSGLDKNRMLTNGGSSIVTAQNLSEPQEPPAEFEETELKTNLNFDAPFIDGVKHGLVPAAKPEDLDFVDHYKHSTERKPNEPENVETITASTTGSSSALFETASKAVEFGQLPDNTVSSSQLDSSHLSQNSLSECTEAITNEDITAVSSRKLGSDLMDKEYSTETTTHNALDEGVDNSLSKSLGINIIFEGFIMKKADNSKFRILNQWNKRYMILTEDSLFYADTPAAAKSLSKIKGRIKIVDTIECERKEVDSLEVNILSRESTSKPVVLLRMKALSETDLQSWITYISRAVHAIKLREGRDKIERFQPTNLKAKKNRVSEIDVHEINSWRKSFHEVSGQLNFSDPDEGLLSTESIESLRRKLLAASYTAHGSDLGALFDRMDKDKSGAIEMEELKSMVKKMLPHVSDDGVRDLMDLADLDGSGILEKDEFIAFIGNRKKSETHETGQIFSAQMPSQLNLEEVERIRHKILAASYTIHGPDLEAFFHKLDTDANGTLDIREISLAVKKLVPGLSGKQIKYLMKLADSGRNGALNQEEFIHFISFGVGDKNNEISSSETFSANVPSSVSSAIFENETLAAPSSSSSSSSFFSSSTPAFNVSLDQLPTTAPSFSSNVIIHGSPEHRALEQSIKELEELLCEKKNILKKVVKIPSNQKHLYSLGLSQVLSTNDRKSPVKDGAASQQLHASKYGIHRKSWVPTTQIPLEFDRRPRPFFVDEENEYEQRVKSLPKKKSMAELINPELLKRKEKSPQKATFNESVEVRPLNSKEIKEKKYSPKICVHSSGQMELNAGRIVSHLNAVNVRCGVQAGNN